MNRRKNLEAYGFRQLKNKIFFRTIITIALIIVAMILVYQFILKGRFANMVVLFLRAFTGMDGYQAADYYQQSLRGNLIILLLVFLVLLVIVFLRLYLNWFDKYFYEINRGIDALLYEEGNDVTLLPELSATEKKINTIKHTLEKRKMDAQIEEQRKNDLIVYLAHDLKTPLTSVIGYLTLLRDENQISEELREKYLSISLDKAERLEDLINEFFDITRFNLSNITLEYSRINLTRLLQQLIFEFRPMLQEKNLTCQLRIEPDVMLRCDADKIQRVFDNLLRNAVNYSFSNSTIEVSAIRHTSYITITFVNQGNTIPEEKLQRIFEQFYRLDTARSSNNGGAGLGLAIAKHIIELHYGTISVSSRDEMVTFEVILPLS